MRIDTITVEEATEQLRALGMEITSTTLRLGLEQGQFPFGNYIKTERSCVCFVYPRLLEHWIAEHCRIEDIIDGGKIS